MARTTGNTKIVEVLKHDEATRKNIPTAEYQSVLQKAKQNPVRVVRASQKKLTFLDIELAD